MLQGRLSGDAVGLVQLFSDVPCPHILARRLMLAAVKDLRETGQQYEMHLTLRRQMVEMTGTRDELTAIDDEIEQHKTHRQIPERWHLDELFSESALFVCGADLLHVWAITLIRLCVLESYWGQLLTGGPPRAPHLLAGVHPDAEVFSTGWLADFQPVWAEEIKVDPTVACPTN